MRIHVCKWILFAILAVFDSAIHAQERVELPAYGTRLAPGSGFMWQPPDNKIRPAVLMLHGCAGVGKKGVPSARFSQWGEMLREMGYRVLLVDSFGPRGIQELCTQKFEDRTLNSADRVADVAAALRWLKQRKDVLPEKIGLMGWSHGGSVVLNTVASPVGHELALAIAFYPGCTSWSKKAAAFRPAVPLSIHIGGADDWTPAASCSALSRRVQAAGYEIQTYLYPDAYHGFDEPAGTVRRRMDVPNGVQRGQGVHVGPQPQARELALRRVREYFARKFGTYRDN